MKNSRKLFVGTSEKGGIDAAGGAFLPECHWCPWTSTLVRGVEGGTVGRWRGRLKSADPPASVQS